MRDIRPRILTVPVSNRFPMYLCYNSTRFIEVIQRGYGWAERPVAEKKPAWVALVWMAAGGGTTMSEGYAGNFGGSPHSKAGGTCPATRGLSDSELHRTPGID